MIIETTVTFDKDEVSEIMKKVFTERVSKPPVGHHLEARSHYTDGWKVTIVKDEEPK